MSYSLIALKEIPLEHCLMLHMSNQWWWNPILFVLCTFAFFAFNGDINIVVFKTMSFCKYSFIKRFNKMYFSKSWGMANDPDLISCRSCGRGGREGVGGERRGRCSERREMGKNHEKGGGGVRANSPTVYLKFSGLMFAFSGQYYIPKMHTPKMVEEYNPVLSQWK